MQKLDKQLSLGYLGLAGAAFSMLAYGFYAQYIQGFEPCPLCYFQRCAIGALGLAWLVNACCIHRFHRLQCITQLSFGTLGLGLSLRHLWVQLHPEVAKGSCGMGIQYMIDTYPLTDVILRSWKGTTDCTDTSWRILGFTAPVWLALLFAGAMILSYFLYRYRRHTLQHSV
jgi:protein dithiol:quinone oxidoreductase